MSDSRELAAHDDGAGRQVSTPRATSISAADRLMMMREAMTNPSVDTGKAREMMLLMREFENDERQAEFNRDKGAAIRAMPAIFKRGENTHTSTRYAKFEDMHRAVMPVLSQHHLTLDFRLGYEGNWITVQPILRHDNGFVEEGGVMKGPADEGKGRSAIQAIGSASSYLKRYSMRAMLNLIEDGEDDDGRGVARPDYQLNDRQSGLIVDAQMAADRSEYVAWYGRQNTRDKAFLVSSGTHARLGGASALPGAQTVDQPRQAAEDQRQQAPAGDQGGLPPKRTARRWTTDFVAEVNKRTSAGDLAELESDNAADLAALKDAKPDLWNEAKEAIRLRLIDITADDGAE